MKIFLQRHRFFCLLLAAQLAFLLVHFALAMRVQQPIVLAGSELNALSQNAVISGESISTVHTFFSDPLRAVPELEPVAAWLSQNGYTNGYASLWNCNIMTEWSNGQLDMRAVNEYTLDVAQTNTWLERLDHAAPPEGKVFLVLSAQELWGAHKESIRNDYNVYWDENDYLVMAFDSYDEMATALQNAHEG